MRCAALCSQPKFEELGDMVCECKGVCDEFCQNRMMFIECFGGATEVETTRKYRGVPKFWTH